MIDLHLHTTASDGHLSSEDLVARVAGAGVTVMAVTDHDTIAGVARAEAAAAARGIRLIPGIEITAVEGGRDVHVLGYFIDVAHRALASFLESQRADRRRRIAEMAARLAALGIPIDADALVARHAGRAVGRPAIAAELVRGGHVATIAEAFDKYLDTGGAAYVPRIGAPVAEVARVVREAGGVASIAHPGLHRDPSMLARVAPGADAVDAIEVFHTEHDEATRARLLAFAEDRRLLVTGGSDFHGDAAGRTIGLGRVGLPREHFDRLAGMANR